MTTFKELQTQLLKLPNKGELSDGYHTYNELYEHRMILFSIICNTYSSEASPSKPHLDGASITGSAFQPLPGIDSFSHHTV